MARPLIGVNLDFEPEPNPRSVLRETYYDAVFRAGGTPVLLPPVTDPEYLADVVARLDGLVLTGGDDIHPEHWGEELHPTCKLLPRRRLDFDLALARAALERRLPILAICCGMQAINVVRGGSLIQDIPSCVKSEILHKQKGADPEHEVAVEPGTRLREIVGRDRIVANSAHHQSCGRMGADLRVAARAPDGVIEAWEDPAHPFLIGLQWHPERIAQREEQLALFRALVEAARPRG
ncbi:MAG TPA: gamma-glutamyl-gamma-aminobutyrate hydrolase family protein [Planctomycetota bacterium]|nr:gamma-glutamyl-gamma-aminobutyrate hydrolase family protein [Planctomycetota bacterium]